MNRDSVSPMNCQNISSQNKKEKMPHRVVLTGDVLCPKFGRNDCFSSENFTADFPGAKIWPAACFCTVQKLRTVLHFLMAEKVSKEE